MSAPAIMFFIYLFNSDHFCFQIQNVNKDKFFKQIVRLEKNIFWFATMFLNCLVIGIWKNKHLYTMKNVYYMRWLSINWILIHSTQQTIYYESLSIVPLFYILLNIENFKTFSINMVAIRRKNTSAYTLGSVLWVRIGPHFVIVVTKVTSKYSSQSLNSPVWVYNPPRMYFLKASVIISNVDGAENDLVRQIISLSTGSG